MNADRLLEHYDRIADAPDAVARLRRFILDLAVRGKLVPQDHDDESAPKMLKRLKLTVCSEGPFCLPMSWGWVSVGSVAEARLGKMLDKAKNRGTPQRYLRNINVRWFDFDLTDLFEMRFEDSELAEFTLRAGDVLICEGGEPGRAAVWDEREPDVYFQKAVHRVRFSDAVDPDYFVKALKASADDRRLSGYFTGTGIKHFTGKGLEVYLFPLPPRAEQHRIGAKVDELMALCDRLEAARAKREATRDRLAAASLARLNAPDPITFQDDARFALDALPALTGRPDQVRQLRQTILNLAVRGKLVPQDANYELDDWLPAVAGSKQSVERDIAEPPLSPPDGWIWLRIADVFEVAGGIQKTPQRAPRNNAYPYLSVGNVYRGRLDFTNVKKFELEPGELERRRLESGDILIIEGNGSFNEIGRCAKWNGEINDCVHQNHVIRCRPYNVMISDFVLLFLNSSDGTDIMQRLAITSSGLYSLSVGKIRQIQIPLPPLAEQRRIVAAVDELMVVCDRLEASLANGADIRSRLLEALLAEALLPVDREAA